MKVNFSPLNLKKFQVQDFTQKTILSEVGEENYGIETKLHTVDLDFEQFLHNGEFLVSMDLHVNKKKDVGYELKVEAYANFFIEEHPDLTEQMKENLLGISSVNIMISNIRGYLRNVTAYGFFGPYLLPSVDVNDLLAEKRKQQQKKLKKK